MLTLITLFFGAFLAATIIPFSSEFMLIAALQDESIPVVLLIAAASAGNVLGSVVNWLLGRFLLHWSDHRWFPFSDVQIEKATSRFHRYGQWSVLFAFVPIIGDSLTLAAGFLRMNFWLFLLLVSIGKIGRYVLIGMSL